MYKPSPFLAPLLFVPGLIFEALVRGRNLSYSAGLLSSRRLHRPVISVGNLTLGGSGKTPLVIHVARTLTKLGHIPAALSRGYGRRSLAESHVLPPGNDVLFLAYNLGDEPALIRRYVPEIWLGISMDRYSIGREIEERCPKVIFVLDDGFQHRQLSRDMDIVVIDRSQPFLRDHVFPRGTLREPLSGLRRCQAVILNGISSAPDHDLIKRAIQKVIPHNHIFSCTQRIDSLVPFTIWNNPAAEEVPSAKCSCAYLAAALGNPERFRNDVEKLEISIVGSRFFRDHHRLTHQNWQNCIKEAGRRGAEAIIITEKDAVKILEPPDFPLLVAIQSTLINRPAEFEQLLAEAIREAP